MTHKLAPRHRRHTALTALSVTIEWIAANAQALLLVLHLQGKQDRLSAKARERLREELTSVLAFWERRQEKQ